MKQITEKQIDTRTRRLYLKNKKISSQDVNQYLETLPDDQDNFELLSFDEEVVLDDSDTDTEMGDENDLLNEEDENAL